MMKLWNGIRRWDMGLRRKNRDAEPGENSGARLKAVEMELVCFYEYCKEAGFSAVEMQVICWPLESAMRHSALRRMAKITLAVVLLVAALHQLLQFGAVQTHAMVLTRILIIKILPLWDWRHSFYDNCLIQNPLYQEYRPGITEEDCASCETVERVDHVRDTNFDFLLGNFLSRDAPVIVTDALETWPTWSEIKSHRFSFENITQLYDQNGGLSEPIPCMTASNLRISSMDLAAFLKRIKNPDFKNWFVHWQNCDIIAVKALRKLYQKPYFLPKTVAPAHYNWVLMSSGYTSTIFKQIELDKGLIMLAQLKGSTVFKLNPVNPCDLTCTSLFGDLLPGEMLVFDNHLWSFEYYPGSNLENVGILTETAWNNKMTWLQ
nr:PREDICTED: uncharacterized protein LOC109042627 [Bemisia tabaci]XP_018915039.1 PREDICTED: uncharacterized protein LOC109042627 [Bemisia tabaci]XP_018915040.1 PREDICTED: uncharacterized protein LOC109042627 [Bemisia tabaci]XP_018915041.1 PREDICTED: uncharacterized protein LOC109042627 [Bemisia tabaci]